jgi:D-alanine-D-alanine ligase
LEDKESLSLKASSTKLLSLKSADNTMAVIPNSKDKQLVYVGGIKKEEPLDVVFPILHGPFGEDGTVQGLLKIMGVPFVGPSVLASAIGMDKEVAKRLWRDAGIPVAKFLVFYSYEEHKISFSKVKRELGLPLFVKPSNLGSSVGVSKVHNKKEFKLAIREAFKYDVKILIEESVKGREIECSVLGNEDPIASIPGEVIPLDEFYSYEAKYIDENGAVLDIPAKLSKKKENTIRKLAVKAFKTICCEGMARIDFFLTDKGRVIINELNTIPGFTNISMYPKLWEISGITYSKLIDILINLAISRHKKEKKLKTSV